MAEFSGKVLSAVFANEDHSIVKVRYEDGDVISVYNLEVSEDDKDYKDLLAEGWDLERITDETVESKKAESHAFNLIVNQAAQQILEETRTTRKQQIDSQFREEIMQFEEKTEDFFTHIAEDTDKDTLFRFKLWALETKDVKESSKELKSKIRKAKTLIEGFAVLHEIKSSK